jgi:hypothetical protein
VNKTILLLCASLVTCAVLARRHQLALNPSATPNKSALEAINASITAGPSDESDFEDNFSEMEGDRERFANPEPGATTPAVSPEETVAPENDSDQALRDFRDWSGKNPERALAAALELPIGENRDRALAAVCFGLAQSNPADAVKLAATFHLDAAAVTENLVQQWAVSDSTSALQWASYQESGEPRDQFIARIAFVVSQTAPADAALLVKDQIRSGPARDEAMMTVLHQWGNRDLMAAAAWAADFPGGLQERAISELEGIAEYQRQLARQ